MTKEERSDYNRQYRKENVAHINTLIKKWAEKNEQYRKEYYRKYKSENKERIRIQDRIRYMERSSGAVTKRYNTKSIEL